MVQMRRILALPKIRGPARVRARVTRVTLLPEHRDLGVQCKLKLGKALFVLFLCRQNIPQRVSHPHVNIGAMQRGIWVKIIHVIQHDEHFVQVLHRLHTFLVRVRVCLTI